MRNALRLLSRIMPPLVGLGIVFLCAWAIRQELRRYTLQDILQSIQAIAPASLVTALALVALSYLVLTGYDTLAITFAGCRLPYRRTALVAALTYAISRTAGLSVLSGSAIRYRFYRRWGVSNLAIAKVIAFCSLSFWIGLFAVGGVLFTLNPPDVPMALPLPDKLLPAVGALGLAAAFAYFAWSALSQRGLQIMGWTVPRLPLPLAIAQLVLTTLDWVLAAGILYLLLPGSLSYLDVFTVYLLAQFAGVFSSVPGGLGVFETVLLLTLSPPIPADALLAALLLYRLLYFVLPLLLAIAVLVVYELSARRRKPSAGEIDPATEIRYGE